MGLHRVQYGEFWVHPIASKYIYFPVNDELEFSNLF